MDISSIVTLITEKSVTIFIIAYFVFRDYKFMTTLQNTLTTLQDTMDIVRSALISRGVNE